MTIMASDACPRCGATLDFDEVDIGIGIERGNPGCPECHWTPPSEDREDDPRTVDEIIGVEPPRDEDR